MEYLVKHMDAKKTPGKHFPKIQSVFSFAHPYHPHPYKDKLHLKETRTALYAQGEDYHFWLKDKLKSIAENLSYRFPTDEFLFFTDSSPVLERDWAYQSGIGWIGKNTCTIHPQKGSLFFLGEIYSSLQVFESPKLMHDFCGNCNKCIEICPTQAIEKPRVLNATKCISYWTIEAKEVPPENIRDKIGDWLFGCDLCQTICPWNQKVYGKNLEISYIKSSTDTQKNTLVSELRLILTSSGKSLEKFFYGTPLIRARPKGLKRNAIIVAANKGLKELTPEIKLLMTQDYFKDLCLWALNKLDSV